MHLPRLLKSSTHLYQSHQVWCYCWNPSMLSDKLTKEWSSERLRGTELQKEEGGGSLTIWLNHTVAKMFASDRDFTDLTDNMNASFLPCRSLRGVCVGIHTFRILKKEWCEFMQIHVRVQEPTKEPTTRKCCVCSAPIIWIQFWLRTLPRCYYESMWYGITYLLISTRWTSSSLLTGGKKSTLLYMCFLFT